MFVYEGIILNKNYYDSNFPKLFGKRTVIDEDIDGNQYRKEIRYMKNVSLTNNDLLPLIINEKKYVAYLVEYITKHLPWGQNVIMLKANDIANNTPIHKTDVYKAIKRLIDLQIIHQMNKEKEEYKDYDKHLYIVNHNYIFKGNTKNLRNELLNR